MDAFSTLPAMKAVQLIAKADEFANILVSELEALNKQYPEAQLDQDAKDYLQKTSPTGVSCPSPQDYRRTFESIFCRYIASRSVITPE